MYLGHLGLEPRTIRLKAEYSTIELVTLLDILYKITFKFTRPNFFQKKLSNPLIFYAENVKSNSDFQKRDSYVLYLLTENLKLIRFAKKNIV